ncbi:MULTISPECIES: hypothetical protein [Bradyrhizobium]|nr:MULTISPECIES: hypothetical protein [Bradyrhizobium]MBR0882426.1 hypothetical protein [Bradyrhizobium liaoningense]MBR1003509.1 hypothetical protein [Bradyrhizobium liaoningense]MBR1029568.1 hypothetical protein [Bradyrhizobium liaoningense]MBR1068262.1 hypothetical protein [Bradyrhizobium liaoningense]MCP1747305.1 hypothetical protein [Bradyrhizobium japonicum]
MKTNLNELGKDAAEGIFGVGQTEIFYTDAATGKVKELVEAYRKMCK